MWSTSLSCLHTLDAFCAKARCGIVYFRWTKYLQCHVFLLLLIFSCQLNFAQEISSADNFSNITEITTINDEENNLNETAVIYPFFNENDTLKLSIKFNKISGTVQEKLNVTINRIGPRSLRKCTNGTDVYEINNEEIIIIPNYEEHHSFLLSKCKYEIIIPFSHETYYKVYEIPDVSPVKNITTYVYYDESKHEVKLNISWEKPVEPLVPYAYHVRIKNFPHERGKDCISQERYPRETHTEFDVISGCSYTIEVAEEPNNDLDPPHINYTVPECVGVRCSCKYKKPKQPIIISVQSSKKKLLVTWRPPNAVENISTIIIKMYEHVYKYQKHEIFHFMRNITEQMNGSEVIETLIPPPMKSGIHHTIQAWYVNSSNCESLPTTPYNYNGQALVEEDNDIYKIMVASMFILMIVFIICLLWKCRVLSCFSQQWICSRFRTHTHPQIRRIYRPAPVGNRNTSYLSVPMEYNNLYIEKEIAEEQERGKVDKLEISYTRLEFMHEIGNGAFGQVFLARATAIAGTSGCSNVAVKKLKKTATSEELDEFLLEIAMLKQIGRHPNVVTLLGCCTLQQPYCMIMEFVPCGDLLRYLRALRRQYERKGKMFSFTVRKNSQQEKQIISDSSYIIPESIPSTRLPSVTETEYTILASDIATPSIPDATPPRTPAPLECVLDPRELQSFAMQIARGMKHLECKQIVHRDLAARNVLIDENKTLKISDFGLSRSGIYVNSKQKKVPLRWLSVEAIRDNLYTNKSDVWAYGVVLWEIGTLGGFPYPTVANHEILHFLLKGKRLEKPENCTDELYVLMQKCWNHSEDERPSFSDIVEYLELTSTKCRLYVDFNQLNPTYMLPPTEEQNITQIRMEGNVKTIEIVVTDKDR